MPKLVYDVVFKLDNKSVKTLKESLDTGSDESGVKKVQRDVNDLKTSLLQVDRTAEDAKQALQGIGEGTTTLTSGVRRSRQEINNMSKSVNNSNQILFSFGDAVQDSAQFQFGFAQGARAIGNNLTFAAEQIALANQKTGSIGETFKLLKASLLGPAGVVFAVNFLVTAITLLPSVLGKSEKKLKDFNKGLVEAREELEKIGELPTSLADVARREIEDTERLIGVLRRRVDLENQLAEAGREASAAGVRGTTPRERAIRSRIDAIDQLLGRLGLENRSLDELKATLKGLNAEYDLFTDATGESNLQLRALFDLMETRSDRVLGQYEAGLASSEKQLRIQIGSLQSFEERLRSLISQGRVDLVPLLNETVDLYKRLGDELPVQEQEAWNASITDSIILWARFSNQLSAQSNLFQDILPDTDGLTSVMTTAEEQRKARLKRDAETLGFSDQKAAELLGSAQSVADKEIKINKDKEEAITALTRRQTAARVALYSQAASAMGNILGAAFGQSKEVRIAQALLDTFAAAQSAYASQLIPGDPTSVVRAKVAAALAIASGLARVAQMRQIEPGSGAGSGGSGGRISGEVGQQGITTNDVPRPRSIGAEDEDRDIVINLSGDISDRSISIRAERGRKQRVSRSIAIRGEQ